MPVQTCTQRLASDSLGDGHPQRKRPGLARTASPKITVTLSTPGVHVTGMLAGSVTCATTARGGSTRVLNAPKSLGIGPFPPPKAPDHQPATKNVPTPVSVDRLAFWLEGYDSKKAEFLLDGFRHGFRVGFQGKVTSIVHKNLKSAALQPQVVDQHIKKEISAGRMHGPFVSPPFPQFQCSPVGLVEKKTKGEFRMIHHLSFPEGQSINDGIGPEHSHVRYATIEEAIMVVRTLCAKAFMCKTDVKHAFRIIPVHPDEYHLFVFQWKGCFYVDLALQMGCSASCKIFEAFSSAVEWIGRKKLGLNMVHILDDFFLASVSKEVGTFQLRSFLEMCSDLGLPMSPEKTFGPQTTMSFVGFEIDTVEEEVRLPVEKLTKCTNEISQLLACPKATLRQLQAILGLLNFACEVIIPGRPFLRRLIDLTIGVKAPHFRIRLTKEVKEDLRLWLAFLEGHNGKCLFQDLRQVPCHEVNLYTDASGSIGYGAIFGSAWFCGKWSEWWTKQNITLLELYPIVMAVETWGRDLENKQLILHTDNSALVSVLSKQTSKEPIVMVLVRRLVLKCLELNLTLTAKHVRGKDNSVADALSRLQVQRFRSLCPVAASLPTRVPPLPASLG